MHNVCFATQKCLDPFFADRFQRLVERCLIGRKAIIPNCGRACFIDHFKRPVGRLKPIDVDAYFSAVLSNSTRQSRLNKFWIAHAFLRTPSLVQPPYPIAMGPKKSWLRGKFLFLHVQEPMPPVSSTRECFVLGRVDGYRKI